MILTVDEFREHVETSLGDAAVQRLLDGAEALIVARAGAAGAATELVDGRGRFVTISRPASAVTSVVERYGADDDPVTLAADDYILYPGGTVFERITGGTNSSSNFRGRVFVTYTPASDDDLRAIVQLGLVKLDIAYDPALKRTVIGAWTEEYNTERSLEDQREDLLSLLDVNPSMVVIG